MIKDDVLGRIIRDLPLESPPDDFVDKVMAGIPMETLPVTQKNPFYLFLRSVLPWILLAGAFTGFFMTSDIPMPGREYLNNTLLPYLSGLFQSIGKGTWNSNTFSYVFMILLAGAALMALDWFLKRKTESPQGENA